MLKLEVFKLQRVRKKSKNTYIHSCSFLNTPWTSIKQCQNSTIYVIPIGILAHSFKLLWDSVLVEKAVYKVYLRMHTWTYIINRVYLLNSRWYWWSTFQCQYHFRQHLVMRNFLSVFQLKRIVVIEQVEIQEEYHTSLML